MEFIPGQPIFLYFTFFSEEDFCWQNNEQLLRKRGVGDILRGVYNELARDPNSLSNLDQDLPNFIQDQVPIYSLPQEWLWCESWCSMETKKTAKTIDLCNNPLHKEPKLDMAKRVISGDLFTQSWVSMDEEIHAFEMEQVEQKQNGCCLFV